VKVTPFDPSKDLILVRARAEGPRAEVELRLVLDTGASQTILVPEVRDELGYEARQGEALSAVVSPLGRELGYRIRVRSFEALGYARKEFSVSIHDLGNVAGIDGLIGLSFLHHFDYEVRSKQGRIRVRPD
jgi:predicted aspartyl protease